MIAVTTTVSGDYKWFIPLFNYCLKKSYPEYEIVIFLKAGKNEKIPDIINENIHRVKLDAFPNDPIATATARFLCNGRTLSNFDAVLITDVDILMNREKTPMHEQRLKSMVNNKLECYDNYTSKNTPQCPGVHFVTKDWWKRTCEARGKCVEIVKKTQSFQKDYDEIMLWKIIKDSNLPLPPEKHMFWTHGVHLGTFRNMRHGEPILESLYIQELLNDDEFIKISKECGDNFPLIKNIIKNLRLAVQ